MKSILVFFLSITLSSIANAREINSRDSLGGVRTKNIDPFQDMNKSPTSREDKQKAEDILRELGYGRNLKNTQNNRNQKRSGEGRN